MSRIGTEVSKSRIQAGMSQKQLAKAVGVSESFIREVETGSKVVSDDMFGRIAKILDCNAAVLNMFTSEIPIEDKVQTKKELPKKGGVVESAQIQEVWDEALGNILKTVPVYKYTMDKILEKRQHPIENNKVKGYPKEKVFYLKVEDNDMSGLRIHEGDIAFCVLVNDIDKDGIYFVEYGGTRIIRQVKKLNQDNVILISNKNMLRTETLKMKDIKVIAKLVTLEVVL